MADGSDEPEELPEGSMETQRVLVRMTINSEGESEIFTFTRGNGSKTSYVGMLAFAQNQLLNHWGDHEHDG